MGNNTLEIRRTVYGSHEEYVGLGPVNFVQRGEKVLYSVLDADGYVIYVAEINYPSPKQYSVTEERLSQMFDVDINAAKRLVYCDGAWPRF